MMTEATFKGVVHATAGVLFAVMGAYNLMRWCETRHRRNATNLALYLPMVLHEFQQARCHWRTPDGPA